MQLLNKIIVWFVLSLLVILFAGYSVYQSDTALLLEDIVAGNGESRLKNKAPTPQRLEQTIPFNVNSWLIDIYKPSTGEAQAVIMLIPGADEHGKDERRLVAFAYSLARVGFMVLVPELPDFQNFRLRPENAQQVALLVKQLYQQGVVNRERPFGIAAFSYAVGPVFLAASSAELVEQVDFILAVGGYYNIYDSVSYITTGYFQTKEKSYYLTPHPYARMVLVESHLEFLGEHDQRILRRVINRLMRDQGAPVKDLVAQLSPAARALYTLAENRDPKKVKSLIDSLPKAMKSNIASLDLASHQLHRLHSQVILIHGRDDNMIPFPQSQQLGAVLPNSYVYIVDGLSHVDVRQDLMDSYTFFQAIRALLQLRKQA
ncbi:MAG: hypothetical protein HUJ30_03790 [Gammaproteobacteria bacterium]|nr:hypothetical protein [Gammaproteobacteria bacterium]